MCGRNVSQLPRALPIVSTNSRGKRLSHLQPRPPELCGAPGALWSVALTSSPINVSSIAVLLVALVEDEVDHSGGRAPAFTNQQTVGPAVFPRRALSHRFEPPNQPLREVGADLLLRHSSDHHFLASNRFRNRRFSAFSSVTHFTSARFWSRK